MQAEFTCKQKTLRTISCGLYKPKLPGEEEDGDWSVILTPTFSSGESDNECKVAFLALDEDAKDDRLRELWRRLTLKA